jgi:hypothetical protein
MESTSYLFNNTEDWRDRGFYMRTPPLVMACYDPAGSGKDRDAVVLLNREEHQKGEPHDPDFAVAIKFRVLGYSRMPPQFEFPEKMASMLSVNRQLNNWHKIGKCSGHVFTVETNGVGWALASALKSKLGEKVISYTTVGSPHEKPFEGGRVSMPRLAALDHVRVLLETGHLRMAPDAPGGKDLQQEMGSFVWRRPGRPEAMEGQHDDGVMALTGGCWIGTKIIAPLLKAKTYHIPQRRRA